MNYYALFIILSFSLMTCTSARKESSLLPATGPAGSPPPTEVKATAAPVAPIVGEDGQRRRGVDFVAAGNEPFWSLEMSSQGMRFRTATASDSLRLPLPAPSQAQDAPVLRYRATAAADELEVTIAQRPCANDMSGEVLPYTVRVRTRTAVRPAVREFAGCGRYLGDYRLHDIWALESIDGQAVVATQFAQNKPYLELNLTSRQALGFSGCNGFGGSLTMERAGLKFGTLRGTMLACPALAFEQNFRKALSERSFTYQLENRLLTLKNRINTLVFKKVD